MSALYPTSPIKRRRRSNKELDDILDGAVGIIDGEAGSITIRHLFYRLVSLKLIEKTEREYQNLCGHLMKWRRGGQIRYDAFTDSTRYYRGAKLRNSAEEALMNAALTYRKNLWIDQDYYVEVWCEKDAIADVLGEAANEFGVPVFPCHGFASATSLYNASQNFKHYEEQGKTVRVLYFGDHDPSGLAIDRNAKTSLADDHGVDVEFVRLAVMPDDIVGLSLPTRPVKKSDTRSIGWDGGCVEVDAMPMNVLRQRVRTGITELIDPHQWKQAQEIERLEKETLAAYAENYSSGRDPR
jgi:hypothetical protein